MGKFLKCFFLALNILKQSYFYYCFKPRHSSTVSRIFEVGTTVLWITSAFCKSVTALGKETPYKSFKIEIAAKSCISSLFVIAFVTTLGNL